MKGVLNWRLPTKEELNKMYENLHKRGIGGFADEDYWSSELGGSTAWGQYFYDGYQGYFNKGNAFRVRAVRGFKIDLPCTNHYKVGQEFPDGIIFDIQDNTIFLCKKEDEEDTYTWDEAKELFEGKDNSLCDSGGSLPINYISGLVECNLVDKAINFKDTNTYNNKEDIMKIKEIKKYTDTFKNKKLTITIKSDEIGSGKTVAGHYLYKLLRDSGAFVRVIVKGDVVNNSAIMENLSMCNNLGDYTGKLFDIVIED